MRATAAAPFDVKEGSVVVVVVLLGVVVVAPFDVHANVVGWLTVDVALDHHLSGWRVHVS